MSAARAALASVDSSIPMYFAETVDARYDRAIALPRFTAGLVSAFSTLALVLAGVGIFGVTGYAVAQRTREFGIRFALGAQRRHVGALVLRRVVLLAGIGLAIGTAVGLGLGSLMSGILFGVEPGDPLTLAFVIGAVGVTAILASLVAASPRGRRESGGDSSGRVTAPGAAAAAAKKRRRLIRFTE